MTKARFLLDSNICIYILDRSSSEATRRLEQCEIGEAVTSSIVCAEVLLGAAERNGYAPARGFFDQLPVLPFDETAAEIYARLPFKRQSFDRLIAAQALALNLTIVTSNVKDFSGIPGLRVEDWTR